MAVQSPNGIPGRNDAVNSISRQSKYEPFDLQVARGQIAGHTTVSLFGYQGSVTTAFIPIWENASTYTYPTTATTLTVVSSSASDAAPASVLISGLDINFNPVSEVLTLNGTIGVTTTKSYFRVNSLQMVGVASGQVSNVGTITAKQSSNTLAQINAAVGKSQSTIYTVPANNTFYLDWVEANTSNSYTSGNYLTYQVQATNNSTGVQSLVLQQPFTSIYTASRVADPFAYAEKTDIQWQLKTSASTYAVGIIVTGKLIANSVS